jgi:hypothetical protein
VQYFVSSFAFHVGCGRFVVPVMKDWFICTTTNYSMKMVVLSGQPKHGGTIKYSQRNMPLLNVVYTSYIVNKTQLVSKY